MQKEIRALFAALMLTALGTTVTNAAGLPQGDKDQRNEEKYRTKLANEVRHQ